MWLALICSRFQTICSLAGVQRLDLVSRQGLLEARHLGRDSTVADDLYRRFFTQALEIAGKQCRAHAAQSLRVMALGAVFLVKRGRVGSHRGQQ
jgi:hypothetical protein